MTKGTAGFDPFFRDRPAADVGGIGSMEVVGRST